MTSRSASVSDVVASSKLCDVRAGFGTAAASMIGMLPAYVSPRPEELTQVSCVPIRRRQGKVPGTRNMVQSFSGFVSDGPEPAKKSAECKSISGAGTGRSARTASLPVSLARAFRRVPVRSTHFVRRQAGPLAHRLRMAAAAFSLKGAFSAQVPSGRQGVASSCRIRLASTIRSSASS